jgi:hypothetical protein
MDVDIEDEESGSDDAQLEEEDADGDESQIWHRTESGRVWVKLDSTRELEGGEGVGGGGGSHTQSALRLKF